MSTREERRAARANWPIRRLRLGEEELVDPRDTSTIDERLALVWQLTCEAWSFQRREMPDYDRRDAPGVVIRPR